MARRLSLRSSAPLVRAFCGTLHATGCRISEALALTAERVDPAGRVVALETLKERCRESDGGGD